MKLDDIVNALPSGLHDAALHALHLDFRNQRAVLTLDVCVGDPDAERAEDRERRRAAEVVLSGLVFGIVEAPAPAYPYDAAGPVRIDLADLPEDETLRLPPLPEEAFVCRLFVDDWNSFITLAATDAALRWLETV